jgi:hypothetical protein
MFSASPKEVEPGSLLNNPAVPHVSYSLKVAGRTYAVDFFPPGVECTAKLVVQCLGSGTATQLLIARYVAQTVPKLANYGTIPATTTPSATPVTPATTPAPAIARAAPAASPATDANRPAATARVSPAQPTAPPSPPTSDTILIETGSGAVRVKNFYLQAKERDEAGSVILENKPNYVISFNPQAQCSQNSRRQGCFSIALAATAAKADETEAQVFLLQLLDVSPSAFCKLPVAVTWPGDKGSGPGASTPPSVCPNGQSLFQ